LSGVSRSPDPSLLTRASWCATGRSGVHWPARPNAHGRRNIRSEAILRSIHAEVQQLVLSRKLEPEESRFDFSVCLHGFRDDRVELLSHLDEWFCRCVMRQLPWCAPQRPHCRAVVDVRKLSFRNRQHGRQDYRQSKTHQRKDQRLQSGVFVLIRADIPVLQFEPCTERERQRGIW
jgi:hypothetical protein